MHAGAFNSYTGQLAVSVQENAAANGQWAEGNYIPFWNNKYSSVIILRQMPYLEYSIITSRLFAGFFF